MEGERGGRALGEHDWKGTGRARLAGNWASTTGGPGNKSQGMHCTALQYNPCGVLSLLFKNQNVLALRDRDILDLVGSDAGVNGAALDRNRFAKDGVCH